ncbi:MAG: hypothetical protein IJ189_13930 [Clostridia bacterium]|nr:hypothetical protein [Clostridia bacterium]
MAQYTNHFNGTFDALLAHVDDSVSKSSLSASREGGSDFASGDIRCATRVYERYSMLGENRLSLSVTIFGRDGDLQLSAITAGGSQAMFFKINTWGEESFLNDFVKKLERYEG